MLAKIRGSLLTAVFSVIGTTAAIQLGFLGPGKDFFSNLLTVAVIWIVSRVVSYVLAK